MDQLPRLGKRELICLLLFTCNYVVSVWRGFLFLWVLGMDYVILSRHSLNLPYRYSRIFKKSILDFKDVTFDSQIIFGVKCNSKWGQTSNKDLVSISHYLNVGVF